MKITVALAITFLSCLAYSAGRSYSCQLVTQKEKLITKSFDLKHGAQLSELEFENPHNKNLQKASIRLIGDDALTLEIFVREGKAWTSTGRTLISGETRSALLEDIDHNYLSCSRK